jgi:hypothetical protein
MRTFRTSKIFFSTWTTIAAFLLLNPPAYPQGTIYFSNKNIPTADGSGTYNAPIYLLNGSGPGEKYNVALYSLRLDGSLRGMIVASFRSGTDSAYIIPLGMPFDNPEIAPGATGLFVIRVWTGSLADPMPDYTYGAYFQSKPFRSLPLGAADGTGAPGLTGLQSFSEPPPGPNVPDPWNSTFELYLKDSTNWTNPGQADLAIDNSQQDIPFWQVFGHVDYIKTGPQPHPGSLEPGNFAVDLATSAGSGGFGRRLEMPNGFHYRLNFYYSGNPDPAFTSEPSLKKFKVMIGSISYEFSYDTAAEQNSLADMKWKRGSIPFASPYSDSLNIKFICDTPGIQAGPVIDSVTIDRGEPDPQNIILTFTQNPGEFSWNTIPTFSYTVEARLDFNDPGIWYRIAFPIATGATLQFSDPDALKHPYEFYRVIRN